MRVQAGTVAVLAAVGTALAAACAERYGTAGGYTATAQMTAAPARSLAETQPPFSGPANVEYAGVLWQTLVDEHLAGPEAIQATPYEGQEPHGAILVTVERPLTLGEHTGQVIVKRNHLGEGVSKEAVANDPARFLDSVTVMYQREAGYDPDHKNWFWAKYKPDGSLATNPKGMALAGRVAKGADQGCIACHAAAPGGDYVYNHDRLAGM